MIGQRIGPYEVLALLGKGGMGEVYRARDEKLGREVALKILPVELAKDPDRLARFEREAKVLASLQHQNIASIFGFEDFDGRPVLAMELAEGDDLSIRISARNLSGSEIEKVARQMARGLEYAHERTIVHRDLKPANVKIFGDGDVKILDFGLARAFSAVAGEDSTSSSSFQATVTQGLTLAGTVLGTAAYMSPEQARGYDVDRRSDIWAFGVILYEMLTGDRLFEGETASDTLAAILRKEPDWDALPADASPLLVHLCRRCLEKDPQNRMRDMGEVRVALEGSSSTVIGMSGVGAIAPAAPSPASSASPLPWIAAGILAVALGAVGFLGLTGKIGPKPEPAPMVHSSIALPAGVQLSLNPAAPGPVAVSPDSRHLAFSAVDTAGQVMLYVRTLDESEARPIPGTLGAHYPFWSPDSRTIAFFSTGNKLSRVDIAGGPILNICSAENGKGGSWNDLDQIIFAPSHISSIYMVPATGGVPEEMTKLTREDDYRSHRFPKWLPGGESFMYIAVARNGGGDRLDSTLRYFNLADKSDKEIMPTQTSAEYASGEILFVHDSILMARPFDPERAELTGPARPILDGVLAMPAAHLSVLAVQSSGVLAYSSGGGGFGNSQLYLMDADGSHEKAINEPMMTFGFDLSPDGNRLTLSMPDAQNGTFDIWILEIDRNLRTRFTFDPETELRAVWSPDGEWIAYSSDRNGRSNLYRKRVSGTGSAELIFEWPNDCAVTDWSRDGNLMAYTETDSTGKFSLGIYDFTTKENRSFHDEVAYLEGDASFSPDGKWLAHLSTETGQIEVFVESLVPGGGRWRVSASGGFHPRWSPEGDKIYYLGASGDLMVVPLSENSNGGLQFGTTAKLAGRVEASMAGSFAVNPATGQIVVQRSTQQRQSSLLALVTQWQNLLTDKN